MDKRILMPIFLMILVCGIVLVSAEAPSSGGGGGGAGARIFYINDTFEITYTDGVDTYEAGYKIWKIEEQDGKNVTTLTGLSWGGIAVSNAYEGKEIFLSNIGKMIFTKVYISGDEKWIAITLENAEFKNDSNMPSSPGSGSGGGSTNNISNSTTAPGGSGGGGGSCSKYYTCEDGTQINYCSMVREEIPITCINSTTPGAGPRCTGGSVSIECVCEENPESLCPPTSPSNSSSGGGSSGGNISNNTAPSGSGSGGGLSSCSTGCNLNGSCVAFGYRVNNTYCDLNKNFTQQKQASEVCENDFECSTNLCIDGKCVSGNVWQKFLKWINRLFGGN
jgi:hypothetical protein